MAALLFLVNTAIPGENLICVIFIFQTYVIFVFQIYLKL